jgi:hypothetical protein
VKKEKKVEEFYIKWKVYVLSKIKIKNEKESEKKRRSCSGTNFSRNKM